MFIRQNKMLLFWIVLIVSSVKGQLSYSVVTYTNKTFEEMQCLINERTDSASWRDDTTSNVLYTYSISTGITMRDLQPKHENFRISYVENTQFNLIIDKLERDDEGTYRCDVIGEPIIETVYHITVEAIPDEFSLDCFVPPDVTCPAQGVNPTSELICTCAAKGVHPDTLSLVISGADNVQQDSTVANDVLFDLSLEATVPVTDSATEVTCSVKGYNTTEPIPPNLITKTLMISPPTCTLDITFDQDCQGATLNCDCSAFPTDGKSPSDSGIVFNFFNGAGDLIAGNETNPFQINDVEAGVDLTYSCRGCNGLYYGNSSYDTASKVCTISTTVLPTTTITTVPLSTNEPTSTKAMWTTTVEPESKSTDNPESGALGTGAIVGISLGALAVVIVIAVIAVIMCKKGKCGSKSDSSYATDGNSTVKDIDIYDDELSLGFNEKTDENMRSNIDNGIVNDGMEIPPPINAEMKKKSDKPDDDGAGPGVDPEIPAYGVIDKNRTKDPTPVPLSSMRDSTNSSKPKQDMEMQYADLDHGNKPPADEVTKSKEKPTEYATVHPVIV